MIFLGNGEYSVAQVRQLKRRLDSAIELLGYVQQPPRSRTLEQAAEAVTELAKTVSAINSAVHDIATALTGKEWMPKC
jgi:uncharacterized protein YoxC